MIKLSGHTLTPGVMFTPESQKLDLAERTSTSSFTLPISEGVSLKADDWILDDTAPGKGIVWRVRSNELTYNTNTRSISLEHVINTLKDQSVFGEVKASDISGSDTCTAREAFEYFLNKQSIWQLGTFEYNVSQPFSFNGETLFSALETITSALDEPMWEYDMSTLPFTLSVKHKPTDPDCEMRAGRNLATLRKSEDRSKMYTRVYPIGKQDLHITGNYISKNESLYGRVDKVLTDQSLETEEALRAWAADKLNRHAQPTVNITISGLDYYAATGETLDRLRINRVCRVPLPEYGTTILEPIVKLSYRDKIKEPENVTVTLCNNIDDVATFIKEQDAAGGRGGRAAAKDAKEDHAWFVDTESHVGMVAEAIIGRDPTTGEVNWSRVAEIIVDGSGIHQQVVRAEGSIVTMYGRQDMTESSLTTVFGTVSGLQGSMVMTAESLTTVYTKTGIDSLGQSETLYSKINQTANSISLIVGSGGSVTPASLILAINNNQSTASLHANVIDIDGLVTALEAKSIGCASLDCDGKVEATSMYSEGTIAAEDLIRTNTAYYLGNQEFVERTFTVDGTQLATFLGSANVNFNIADTQTYRDGVSAARIEGWDLARSKVVTPSASTSSATMTIGIPASTYNQSSSYDFTVSTDSSYAYIKNSLGNVVARCPNSGGSGTDYDAGWAAAHARVVPPINGTGTSFTFKAPPATVNGNAVSYVYDLVKDTPSTSGGYVYAQRNNVTMARIDISDWHQDGWALARSKVVAPSASTTATRLRVGIPHTTYNEASSMNFDLTVDGSYAYIKNLSGTTVCRRPNVYGARKWGYVQDNTGVFYLAGAPTTAYGEGTSVTYNLRQNSDRLRLFHLGDVTVRGTTYDCWAVDDQEGTYYYKSGGNVTVTLQGEAGNYNVSAGVTTKLKGQWVYQEA